MGIRHFNFERDRTRPESWLQRRWRHVREAVDLLWHGCALAFVLAGCWFLLFFRLVPEDESYDGEY